MRKKWENRLPQGSPGGAKIDPGRLRKASGSGSRGGLKTGLEKKSIFNTPGTVKMRLSLKRVPHFHFFTGVPKSSQNGRQNGAKIDLNRPCWPPQGVPEAFTETSQKTVQKNSSKGCQKGTQNGAKISLKTKLRGS